MAKRVFAAAGFRTTLLAAAMVTTLVTVVTGLFTPSTPHLVIIGVLLLGGFSRSFMFTGVNALAFADIDDAEASQATSMSSVMQQVSLALGVAVAAAILESSIYISGEALQVADFHLAFYIIAGLTVIATIPFIRMDRNAGALVSGHRLKTMTAATVEAGQHAVK
jgi:hypothetical protein